MLHKRQQFSNPPGESRARTTRLQRVMREGKNRALGEVRKGKIGSGSPPVKGEASAYSLTTSPSPTILLPLRVCTLAHTHTKTQVYRVRVCMYKYIEERAAGESDGLVHLRKDERDAAPASMYYNEGERRWRRGQRAGGG